MNSRAVAIFAVLVAGIVGIAMWSLSGDDAPHYTPPTPAPAKVKDSQSPTAATTDTTPRISPEPLAETGTPDKLPPQPAPVVPVLTEDDKKIDDALRLGDNSDAGHLASAQALINILPGLTKDGQVEAAQHISNLLTDENWNKVQHIWRNPAFDADVIDVFANDLLNRDDKVKLPALLEAIKIPNHHFNEDAKTTLQIFLDEDYGDNIAKWETATKAYLKKLDDEEREANAGTPGAPN